VFTGGAATEVGSRDNDPFVGNIDLRTESVKLQILQQVGPQGFLCNFREILSRDNFIGVDVAAVEKKHLAVEIFHILLFQY
jgi:hypothetical protein